MSSSSQNNPPADICALIWANAAETPDKVILRDAERSWTWTELLRRADDFAASIAASGMPARAIVPIMVGRSGESIAAILGALLAGHPFSPLSADQPAARLAACLERMEAQFVFADGDAVEGFAGRPVRSVEHQSDAVGLPSKPAPARDTDLLYVLFTSGSTGDPKGVMVDHGNILNTLFWALEILNWTPADTIGLAVNIYFDIAMFDIFTALCSNTPLAIISDAGNVHRTAQQVGDMGITSIFAAPVFFSQFVRADLLDHPGLAGLRRIISGGDFFAPAHVLKWMDTRPDVTIYNVWGPTETSVVNTMHLVTEADRTALGQGLSAPVGRALPRMPFLLLDDNLKRVDGVDARGEICMQGRCVTLGYLKDPQRTDSAYLTFEGERIYRTGDLGSVDENGLLHIHGRIGSLIKVAGHRIDVGEIEGAATRTAGIHAAAAFLHDVDIGLQELWLAIELTPGQDKFDVFAFKKQLRELLPAYMIPKKIVVIDKLPTTPNLKVDRRAIAAQHAS
ncbi:MAG: AMP-binding protein [Cypionkella sp.]